MKKIFSLVIIALTVAVSSYAQQHFTITCNNSGNSGGPLTRTTGSRECNSACALIYTPPLDDKAILMVTPSNANSRLVGVWYKKVDGNWLWNVNYQDAKTMNYGDQFDVQYFANPDTNYQFVHKVNPTGTTQTIYNSYIDHVNLNGNPNAIFHYVARGNGWNMYPVTFKYDAVAGKWYLFNNTSPQKAFDNGAAYNIVIESPGNSNTTTPNINSANTNLTNNSSCNCILPTTLPPNGNAGGDLSGSYPSPSVTKISGKPISNISPGIGQVLKWNGTQWTPADETTSSAAVSNTAVSTGWSLNANTNSLSNTNQGGKVGIGTTSPNAPLGFAPTLGKKITLYPGTTGDVGFGVAGNRLQIYSDNPNADVAIGYDAAGTFTERLAIKGNGALAVNGNTGQAGQVLTSGGNSGPPVWATPGNNIQTFVKYPGGESGWQGDHSLLTGSNPGYVFTRLMHNLVITKKSRLVINAQFDIGVYVFCPLGCASGKVRVEILINGILTPFRLFISCNNNETVSSFIDNFMYDVNPGNYLIEFRAIILNDGGSSSSDLTIYGMQSSIMVLPLE